MRERADIRSIAFVGVFFALVTSSWLWHPSSWALRGVLVVGCCLFSFFCAVITHNTVHVPVFRTRWHNKLFQVVLTLAYGHPVSAYVPTHNLSHHVHTQGRKDIIRTSKLRFRWNLLNQLFFLSKVTGAVVKAELKYAAVMRKRRPAWFRQLMLETVPFFLVMAGLAVLDWQKWLLYVVIPYQYAAWGIVSINYAQHDGCDPESPYNHSRSFVGRLVNWWTFNNGYHGMHHMRPGLHWSKLPEAHRRELSPHIHPNLEQRSFLGYLVRTHIWPGKRVDYRGEPLKLPDAGPDEEWLTRRFMDRPGVSLGAESGDDGQKLGVLPSS